MSDLIADQIAYYRARAPEYDADIVRFGGYGSHEPQGELSQRDVERNEQFARMKQVLRGLGPVHRALELACGSGNWTAELAGMADELVAVDASPEMLAFNRLRVASPKVRYVTSDLFAWQPDRSFDLVMFGFWLTHVPGDRFEAFWNLVRGCLAPGGSVFFLDNLTDDSASPELPLGDGIVKRALKDGREFQLVKVYYDVVELTQRLQRLGWSANIETCGRNYLYGVCKRT
ncbi:MAG TPA: class I SAM-dependent methyltransferase [Chloroflexota bacterium]|nr:class I SAM-dependent methyltransferase [Chloroflexota bacterium]